MILCKYSRQSKIINTVKTWLESTIRWWRQGCQDCLPLVCLSQQLWKILTCVKVLVCIMLAPCRPGHHIWLILEIQDHSKLDSWNITAFTSERTNLSPFTKGCRERDASMWLQLFLRNLRVPMSNLWLLGDCSLFRYCNLGRHWQTKLRSSSCSCFYDWCCLWTTLDCNTDIYSCCTDDDNTCSRLAATLTQLRCWNIDDLRGRAMRRCSRMPWTEAHKAGDTSSIASFMFRWLACELPPTTVELTLFLSGSAKDIPSHTRAISIVAAPAAAFT